MVNGITKDESKAIGDFIEKINKIKKMILTNERVEVTHQMMEDAGMKRITAEGMQFGVPIDPQDASKGLCWKDVFDLTEFDFDEIEEYWGKI